MAENMANKLLESPLLTAIQDRWIEFEEDINSLQVQAADLILYTVWVLDSIKTQTTGFAQTMWKMTHTALRKRFIESQFKSDKGDLGYLTNLTCAYALYCYGLTITDSFDRQDIYSSIINQFGDHWPEIRKLKARIGFNEATPGLKQWLRGYIESPIRLTANDKVDWSREVYALIPKGQLPNEIDSSHVTNFSLTFIQNASKVESNDYSIKNIYNSSENTQKQIE